MNNGDETRYHVAQFGGRTRVSGVLGDSVPAGMPPMVKLLRLFQRLRVVHGQIVRRLALMGELVEGSMPFLPRPRPSKLVVGVPAIIHRLSALRVFANGTRVVAR